MFPSVSVIIPTYNRAQFISQTIDSVLAQTFTDYEIIVVDDGSTDETAQILAGYGNQLRLFSQANSGPSAARNLGLQVAQGEFVGFLDADDLWYPEMLATTVSHLCTNPQIDLICGAWDVIDETGQMIRPANTPSSVQSSVQADFLRTIATGNRFLPLAMLFRRKCFACCGVFDTTLKGVEDWDLWLRLAVHGHKIDLVDIPLARYRRHKISLTHSWQRIEQDSYRILEKLFSNEQLASRLADLKEHAYITLWLTLAASCQERGLNVEISRFIQMAEELYPKAPRNPELSIRHFNRLLSLPDTGHFIQMIAKSESEALLRYYWHKGQQLAQQGHFGLILSPLEWRNIRAFGLGVKDALIRRFSG